MMIDSVSTELPHSEWGLDYEETEVTVATVTEPKTGVIEKPQFDDDDSMDIFASASVPASMNPLPSNSVPEIPIIRAYTIDQWSLPDDDAIIEAVIYRWDDEQNAFESNQPLVFSAGALQIDASHAGLGQPIVIFRLNGEGTFRNVQSKWELDHHTDWLWVRTRSETVMLAIGREPSQKLSPTVYCNVFGDSEPVGSDDPGASQCQDGLVEIPINTFRASKIIDGVTRWSVVPPFSQSRLEIESPWEPWKTVDLNPDGLRCQWDVSTQGDWMVAVEDPFDDSSESMSSGSSEIHVEKQRVEIRTVMSMKLTSTLDDRQSGKLSRLYVDELSKREQETLDRTLRLHQIRRRWRRPTSPMDLQDQDTAYLSLAWDHFRAPIRSKPLIPGVADVPPMSDMPAMTDIAVQVRERPIPVSVCVPSVRMVDKRTPVASEQNVRFVFAEFEIHCR